MSTKNMKTNNNANANEIVLETPFEQLSEQAKHHLRIYEEGRRVPTDATKPIEGGKLKGLSDINTMWRIKKLTEIFGPCGEGWKPVKEREDFVPLGNTQMLLYRIEINLYVKFPDNPTEWSEPIYGVGSSLLLKFEKGSIVADDDAFKKAWSDALSVCCKHLGIGGDIYYKGDVTKYGELGNFVPIQLPTPQMPTAPTPQTFSNIMGENNNPPVDVAQNAVAEAIQTAQGNAPVAPANAEQGSGYIVIDPTTTPLPTVQEAEEYMLEGNGQYTGWKLGAIFRIAASGDQRATGWLNWLATANTKSENMAWAKFYADFLRNYYTQAANEAAKGQTTANN